MQEGLMLIDHRNKKLTFASEAIYDIIMVNQEPKKVSLDDSKPPDKPILK